MMSQHQVQLTLSTAYTKYSIHQVQHTPSTAYTKYSIHHVQHTPSTAYTKYSIHQVQYTPSAAYTKYSIPHLQHTPSTASTKYSIHWVQHLPSTAFTEYTMHWGQHACKIVCVHFTITITNLLLNVASASSTPLYRLTAFREALYGSVTCTVTLSHSESCNLTTQFRESQCEVCLPLTAAEHSSIYTGSLSASASPNSLDHSFQVCWIMASKVMPELHQLWPPSASPKLWDYGHQVPHWVHVMLVCKCMCKLGQSTHPCLHYPGHWVHLETHWIVASKCNSEITG